MNRSDKPRLVIPVRVTIPQGADAEAVSAALAAQERVANTLLWSAGRLEIRDVAVTADAKWVTIEHMKDVS